jgi:uncharacterized protein (UPF0332 family)
MSEKGSTEDLVRYRLERAEQAYKDALLLVEHQSWNAAVNRLYYACLYVSMALLVKNELSHGTHAGVRHQLNLHFIQKGILTPALGKFYNRLSQTRDIVDYKDFVEFDEEEVKALLPQARDFIDTLKVLIQT